MRLNTRCDKSASYYILMKMVLPKDVSFSLSLSHTHTLTLTHTHTHTHHTPLSLSLHRREKLNLSSPSLLLLLVWLFSLSLSLSLHGCSSRTTIAYILSATPAHTKQAGSGVSKYNVWKLANLLGLHTQYLTRKRVRERSVENNLLQFYPLVSLSSSSKLLCLCLSAS